MRYYTPLRYPGGKGKLSYFIKALLEENNLVGGAYVEPFAGGAGIALELLLQEFVSEIYINDIDYAVYSFWRSVIGHTEDLCAAIENTAVTIDEWHKQREILKSSDDILELGFAAFFLNRTNRSGILNAGVIGGKKQDGKWKLDVRFNKAELIERIRKIASHRERIHVTNLDAVQFLNTITHILPRRSLIYLDPPYYVKGQGLYRNFYEHQDHVDIKNVVASIPDIPWMVSYDNCTAIREIYSDFEIFEYALQYTAQDKKVGSELMVFSDSLVLPEATLGKSLVA